MKIRKFDIENVMRKILSTHGFVRITVQILQSFGDGDFALCLHQKMRHLDRNLLLLLISLTCWRSENLELKSLEIDNI